jgi:hypothetical protein
MNRASMIGLFTIIGVPLIASVAIQIWTLPFAVQSTVDVFPVVEPLAIPAIVWGVSAIACWQAIGVILLRIVQLIRADRFTVASSPWPRAIVWYLIVFLALVVAAFVAINVLGYTTPGVYYGLVAAGLIAVVALIWLRMFLASRPAARYLAHA